MPMAVALRSVCRKGSATLTTVPSIKAMLEARIVAANIHLPFLATKRHKNHKRHFCAFLWLKRFVDRLALLREKFRSIRRDVQTVFETNSKLTINHNRGFITKTHPRL